MKKELLSKTLVMGVLVLFVGISIIPSTVGIIDKKTSNRYLISRGYIQDLIDNSSDGDTIYIPNGIYYENITIDKSISLIGEDKDSTIIDGGGNGSVVTIISENVTVENFFIQNGGNSEGDAGISIKTNKATIMSNNIKNNKWSGVIIKEYFTDNIIIKNDISYNGAGGGIRTDWKSRRNTITNNIISHNIGNGIFLGRGAYTIITKNDIFKNDDGIEFGLGSSNYVSENNITFNSRDGIQSWVSHNNTIIFNDISNNGDEGFYSISSDRNNISNNVFSYNPIGMNYGGEYAQICNNILFENTEAGVSVGGRGHHIHDNNFNSNKIGLDIRSIFWECEVSDNVFTNDGFLIRTTSMANVFSNNFINGEPLVYLREETNKVIENNAGQVILARCNGITVHNLTFSNTAVGIQLFWSQNCKIINNDIFNNNAYGVWIYGDGYQIYENRIKNNPIGIYITSSTKKDNMIYNNEINGNEHGIYLFEANNNIVLKDYTQLSGFNTYQRNSISTTDDIEFNAGGKNVIFENDILNNKKYGIYSKYSADALIYHNNFIGNLRNAYSLCYSNYPNTWNLDLIEGGGNYWDDYKGVDINGDNIGDTPYKIPDGDLKPNNNDMDYYPLMEPNGRPNVFFNQVKFVNNYYIFNRFLERFPLIQNVFDTFLTQDCGIE